MVGAPILLGLLTVGLLSRRSDVGLLPPKQYAKWARLRQELLRLRMDDSMTHEEDEAHASALAFFDELAKEPSIQPEQMIYGYYRGYSDTGGKSPVVLKFIQMRLGLEPSGVLDAKTKERFALSSYIPS